jgi:hypothetical protein
VSSPLADFSIKDEPIWQFWLEKQPDIRNRSQIIIIKQLKLLDTCASCEHSVQTYNGNATCMLCGSNDDVQYYHHCKGYKRQATLY